MPKTVFSQGEMVHVRIDVSDIRNLVSEGTLSLIGREKVEFTVQSLLGKKGFHPGWSYFLPSRQLKETEEFLTQTHDLSAIPEGALEEIIDIEIPENAIPSYYGDNGKVDYTIELELVLNNGNRRQETQRILIDSDYKLSTKTELIEINNGKMIIDYTNPLLIDAKNTLVITTNDLNSIDVLRLVLIGREVVTASSITMNNQVCGLPLGQIQFDSDLVKAPMEFWIPSKFQHNYKGLMSRMEYSIVINQVSEAKRLGITRKTLVKLKEFSVNVEYQQKQNT